MSAISTPRNLYERLELANQLFREFHTRCFWHSPRDLLITEDLLPLVVKGLRTYGGRRGFILSGKFQPEGRHLQTSEKDLLECHEPLSREGLPISLPGTRTPRVRSQAAVGCPGVRRNGDQ